MPKARTFTTACPRNCYSTCGMRVSVEDGRLVRIEAHPANEATPEAVCLKGLSYVERVYAEDRVLHPLRRTAAGAFERITWDEALGLVADRLRSLREQPQSVLFYSASGTKGLMNGVATSFWRLYGGCTTTYGDLCWPAGLEATRLTLGANEHNAPWDLANARLVVFWGKNAAETNVHQMAFVQQARGPGRAGRRRRPAAHGDRRARGAAPAGRGRERTPPSLSRSRTVDRARVGRRAVRARSRPRLRGLPRRRARADAGLGGGGRGRARGADRAARRAAGHREAGHDQRRLRHAALHQQRPDDARDASRSSPSPGTSGSRARGGSSRTSRPTSSTR